MEACWHPHLQYWSLVGSWKDIQGVLPSWSICLLSFRYFMPFLLASRLVTILGLFYIQIFFLWVCTSGWECHKATKSVLHAECHKASKAALHADEAHSWAIWIYDLILTTVNGRCLLPLPFWISWPYNLTLWIVMLFLFFINIWLLATIQRVISSIEDISEAPLYETYRINGL